MPAGGIILTLFFFSGVSALIYEVVWTRMLTLVFGTTIYAVSAVLSSYMGGLALGSFLSGKFIDRQGNPLRIYGLLELGIGLFGLAMPLILSGLDDAYVMIYRHFHTLPFLPGLTRFVLSFMVLLVPTAFIGASFPVVSKFFVKQLKRLGWNIGTLYSLNTFGALIGCFASGFFLLGMLGLKGTTYIAIVINLLVGVIALIMSSSSTFQTMRNEEDEQKNEGEFHQKGKTVYSRGIARLVLLIFAVSGFCALAYEVLWTRILAFWLDNTTYAFTTMLSAILCGLALGGIVFARFIDSRKELLTWLGLIEISIGLLAGLLFLVFEKLNSVVDYLVFGELTWAKLIGLRFVGTFLIILVPCFLMGAVFPLASKIYSRSLKGLGRSIGSVYSVNTVGGILGALLAGFFFIPQFGTQNSIILIALINVSIGGTILFFSPLLIKRTKGVILTASFLVILSYSMAVPRGIPFGIFQQEQLEMEPIFMKEGVDAMVTVWQSKKENYKILKINRIEEVPTDYLSLRAFRMLGYLPILQNPSPEQALIVAFGGGIVAGSVAQLDVESVDAVEISPGVIEAAKYFFQENHDVLRNPKFALILDDARNYLLKTTKRYDVITMDATHPASGDSWVLYTREFYELCKAKLTKNGAVYQWLPMHGLSLRDYKIIISTFKAVFPHATLWYAGSSGLVGHTILVGTQNSMKIDFISLKQKLGRKVIKKDLEEVNLDNPFKFVSSLVMDEVTLANYVHGSPINTDDSSYVAFPKYIYGKEMMVQKLEDMVRYWSPVIPLLESIGESDETATAERTLQTHFAAMRRVAKGQIYHLREKLEEEITQYREVLAENPEDKHAQYLLGLSLRTLKYKYLLQGKKYEERGNLDAAIEVYRKATEIDSLFVEANNALGMAYNKVGMFDEAINEYEKALETEPDSAKVRVNLALTLNNKGMYAEALDEGQKAILLEPKSSIAHYVLGVIYANQDMINEAITECIKAVEIDPRLIPAHFQLGMLYIEKEKYERAEFELRTVTLIDPHSEIGRLASKKLKELQHKNVER